MSRGFHYLLLGLAFVMVYPEPVLVWIGERIGHKFVRWHIVVFEVLVACNLVAEPLVTLKIDPTRTEGSIPTDFAGLSFEVALVLPGPDGVHYFRPDNQPLLRLFQTLGIKSLRIGGNTSDRDARQLPSEADLDSLFSFAKEAGVKVIYCLRLHNGSALEDAAVVKHVMAHYREQVDCFSIGQEPSAYPVEKKDSRANSERMGAAVEKYRYDDYRTEWKKFADIIIGVVPDVKFCGPSIHNNGEWARGGLWLILDNPTTSR